MAGRNHSPPYHTPTPLPMPPTLYTPIPPTLHTHFPHITHHIAHPFSRYCTGRVADARAGAGHCRDAEGAHTAPGVTATVTAASTAGVGVTTTVTVTATATVGVGMGVSVGVTAAAGVGDGHGLGAEHCTRFFASFESRVTKEQTPSFHRLTKHAQKGAIGDDGASKVPLRVVQPWARGHVRSGQGAV